MLKLFSLNWNSVLFEMRHNFYCFKADAEQYSICYNKIIKLAQTSSEHKITGSFARKNQ